MITSEMTERWNAASSSATVWTVVFLALMAIALVIIKWQRRYERRRIFFKQASFLTKRHMRERGNWSEPQDDPGAKGDG